ncbi:hypothetical protein NUM3379_02320 [Kineococcus sp. NUM-3379]
MPYTARKPPLPESPEQLRARIPGWGADLDPRDRPSVPRELPVADPEPVEPVQQVEHEPRERSLEHARLTPVFGTAVPTKGLSGVLRRLAYRRWSEARNAHWLVLIAADRVDALESQVASLATRRPDQPLTQSGVLGEIGAHPLASRLGRGRVDVHHQALDPVLVLGPWIAAGGLGVAVVRAVRRRRRG